MKIQDLLKKFETDPKLFIEVFAKRKLSSKQKIFVDLTKTRKHLLAIWSRQTGKSTVISSYIVWRFIYGKGMTVGGEHLNEHIIVLAPIKDQVKNLYDKVRNLLNQTPYLNNWIVSFNQHGGMAKNGNRISFLSASPGSQIRGHTATCIIIDESQDITDNKYTADILPFGATTNALIIEAGTPKTKNHFYYSTINKNIEVVKQLWFECPFISKEYVMQQKANSPDALWRQEFLCFLPDTKIIGPTIKKIQDINIDEKFYNNQGELASVKGVLKHDINEEVYKITLWNGNTIYSTKEHPFYVQKKTKFHRHKIKEDLKFIKAEDLSEGDMIHYPKLKLPDKEKTILDMSTYYQCSKDDQFIYLDCTSKENKTSRFLNLEEKTLQFIGLWIAEGSVSSCNRTVCFSLNKKETELISLIRDVAKTYFNRDIKIKSKAKNSIQVYFNSRVAAEMLIKECGKGAGNKKLPSFYNELSKTQFFNLLKGYLLGDGHLSTKITCVSISKLLIEQINQELLKYNIYSSILQVRKDTEKKKILGRHVTVRPKWNLAIYGLSKDRLYTELNINYAKVRFSKIWDRNTYDLLTIRNIGKIHYSGPVYNLEMGKNNTYLTECGSVHNCEFIEEGVMAFPSRLFEPEALEGLETGRWNLGDYEIITKPEEFTKEKRDEICTLVSKGAVYTAGLDLGKAKDPTVYTIIRIDQRPIKVEVQIEFKLGEQYTEIAKVISMFHQIYQPVDFNFDYSNEKGFAEHLISENVNYAKDKEGHGQIVFTNKNKEEMISNAVVILENYQLILPKEQDKLLSQFLNQMYETNAMLMKVYYHPTNEHDDRMWSVLLALKNVRTIVGDFIEPKDTITANSWRKYDEKTKPMETQTKYKTSGAARTIISRRERFVGSDFKRTGTVRM
jgi:intein/homing endonuclease